MRVYWLEQREAEVPADDSWLSARELVRLEGLRFPKRRGDWRLGRWTAKSLLASYLNLASLADLEIRAAPSGAPEVVLAGRPSLVVISLSHRNGLALCTLAPADVALGCDLELVEPHSDIFVADYFGAEELRLVAASPRDRQDLLVTLIWSAKESALKALHLGLRADTRDVVITGIALPATETETGWQAFQARVRTGPGFAGWWRHAGNFVRTVVASPPAAEPARLPGSIATTMQPG